MNHPPILWSISSVFRRVESSCFVFYIVFGLFISPDDRQRSARSGPNRLPSRGSGWSSSSVGHPKARWFFEVIGRRFLSGFLLWCWLWQICCTVLKCDIAARQLKERKSGNILVFVFPRWLSFLAESKLKNKFRGKVNVVGWWYILEMRYLRKVNSDGNMEWNLSFQSFVSPCKLLHWEL